MTKTIARNSRFAATAIALSLAGFPLPARLQESDVTQQVRPALDASVSSADLERTAETQAEAAPDAAQPEAASSTPASVGLFEAIGGLFSSTPAAVEPATPAESQATEAVTSAEAADDTPSPPALAQVVPAAVELPAVTEKADVAVAETAEAAVAAKPEIETSQVEPSPVPPEPVTPASIDPAPPEKVLAAEAPATAVQAPAAPSGPAVSPVPPVPRAELKSDEPLLDLALPGNGWLDTSRPSLAGKGDFAAPAPMMLAPNEDDLIEAKPKVAPPKSPKARTSGREIALPSGNKLEPGGLLKAYFKAYDFEPTFQTSKAEFESIKISASAARAALLPEFRYTKQRLELESQNRTTMALTVPVIALDRFMTFREGSHRDKLGALTYFQREQELAGRIFKIVSEIVKNAEAQQANRAKMLALKQQLDSAKKMFSLGEGTITDISDTQVRFGQARADSVVIQGKLNAALKQFELTTGAPAVADEFRIRKEVKNFPIDPAEIELPYSTEGMLFNTQVGIAQENYELAKIGTTKSMSAVLPNVTASYVMTESASVQSNYLGLTVNMPIQASGAWGIYGAQAAEKKAKDVVKEAENKALVEIERLKSLLDSGIIELRYRKENIDATTLNIQANQKSFKGGVKSKTDLLNAIQTQYQAQEEYVTSLLTLAENYLNYLLALNVPPEAAINLANKLVF